MKLEKLPLHKYYRKVIRDLNNNYDLLVLKTKEDGAGIIADDILLYYHANGVVLIFILDKEAEIRIGPFNSKPDIFVSMGYDYNGRYYDLQRFDHFVTPEVAKAIHERFVHIQKFLEKYKQKYPARA